MKVLIVGAGPTGLTTALELARMGVKSEIVDAKDAPSWESRAVAVIPRSIEILNRTGVGEHMVKEGLQITAARIHRGNRRLLDIDMSQTLDESKRLIAISQDRTETLMSEQLERMGVSVRYGIKVESVATSNTSAEVEFRGGEKKMYDWVVGADGFGSTVRTSLNIPYEGYELDEDWSIADVELNGKCDYHTINAWLLAGKHRLRDAMVMVPIEQSRLRLISSTPDSLKALPMELNVKNVRRTGTFKISVRQAKSYVRGRALLAGDAAHTHSPVGGRGMNLGIDDGQAAAYAIVHNKVQEYEPARKRKAMRIIKVTERARKLITSNNPLTVMSVYIIGWCVQNIDFIQKKFIAGISTL